MIRNIEIPENPDHADGASLQAYSRPVFELALAALRPEDTEPLVITPPPGFVLAKEVEERDAIHYGAPGYIGRGVQTEWSGGELLRSRKLWTPGIEDTDVDDHPNLLMEVPLAGLPRNVPKPPKESWMSLEVDESALTRGLVRLMPISQATPRPFDTAFYVGHLLNQNR